MVRKALDDSSQSAMDIASNGSHTNMLKLMGGLERKIALGETIPWETLPPNYFQYFKLLALRMKYLFFSNLCVPYFNTNIGRWVTCWSVPQLNLLFTGCNQSPLSS